MHHEKISNQIKFVFPEKRFVRKKNRQSTRQNLISMGQFRDAILLNPFDPDLRLLCTILDKQSDKNGKIQANTLSILISALKVSPKSKLFHSVFCVVFLCLL